MPEEPFVKLLRQERQTTEGAFEDAAPGGTNNGNTFAPDSNTRNYAGVTHEVALGVRDGQGRPAAQYEDADPTRQLGAQRQGGCVDQTTNIVEPREDTHRRTLRRHSSETNGPSTPGQGVRRQEHSMDHGRLLEPAVTCGDLQVRDAAELVTTRRAALGSPS